MSTPASRVWRPDWSCPVATVVGSLRHGRGDPTWLRVGSELVRGIRTPEGPGTLHLSPHASEVRATAWGAGADWALEQLPRLLGAADDPASFTAHHPAVVDAWRRHSDFRIGAADLVMESLLPAIIEQKVTGKEAFATYRRLVNRWGEVAPGPAGDQGLMVPPSVATMAQLPSWEWLQLGVDKSRADALRRALAVAPSLERLAHSSDRLDRALRSIPGIGVWTSAETRSRACGDPDAISLGDYHVSKDIGWALIGRPVDDEELVELLAPYAGHRYRVQCLLGLAGVRRSRRGPRMAPRTHLPTNRPRGR